VSVHDLARAARLCDDGDIVQALDICEAVLKRNPHEAMAVGIAAQCHLKIGKTGIAYHLFRRVLDYQDRPDIWNNLGYCAAEHPAGFDEAINWFERCLSEGDDIVNALANLAMIHCKKGEHEKAIHFAQQALAIDPGTKAAKLNASLSMLALGRWDEGWDWYDVALGDPRLRPRNSYHAEADPLWNGKGGTVVIYGEQGLGDQIMFASMVPDAIKDADRVILDVDPRLIFLFERSFPRATVTTSRNEKGALILPEAMDIDAVMPIGSLGRFYRHKNEDFPGTPYLTPDLTRQTQWRALLDALPKRPKVGIMWRGGLLETGEAERSMELADLLPILSLDCEFVSLNHRPKSGSELSRFAADHGIRVRDWPWATKTKDYDDTAALVAELDLVITAQTSVFHLAGALGKEVFALIPSQAQWRYGNSGDRIVWYGSARLFRQKQAGQWADPVNEIAEILKARGIGERKKGVEPEIYGLG
jgi:tetratricopeptide (TPR) repeat protein